MHAEICPVCKGSGKVLKFPLTQSQNKNDYETCHGCKGLGWITVGVEYPQPKIQFDIPGVTWDDGTSIKTCGTTETKYTDDSPPFTLTSAKLTSFMG